MKSRLNRRYKKVFIIWLLLLVFAITGKIYNQQVSFPGAGPLIFIIFIFGLYLIFSKLFKKNVKVGGTFRDNPASFDGYCIEIIGTVEKVFTDPIIEGIKRGLIDRFRTFIGSSNSKGRYTHQRFLVSSPDILSGQRILIEHNINFGKIKINEGMKFKIKGEYLHRVYHGGKYGKIHFTHAPKGFLVSIR